MKNIDTETIKKIVKKLAPKFLDDLDRLYDVFKEEVKTEIIEYKIIKFILTNKININEMHTISIPSDVLKFETNNMYCPICRNFIVKGSEYLLKTFGVSYTYWVACLVTHYRHHHIRYYDLSWKNPWYRKKNKEYTNYEEFKKLVNNRAKRQMIRAILKDENFTVEGKKKLIESFSNLMHNDKKTEELIKKSIEKLNRLFSSTYT